MARIRDLRRTINTNYLKNDVISAREARDLVRTVAQNGLTAHGKSQLEKLQQEFKDKFSSSGMAAFQRALGKAVANSAALAGTPAGDGQSATSVRAGVNLDNLPTAFKLSEVNDPDVKKALRRMDLNLDGKVDYKDRDALGFSDQQFRMFIFTATLMGAEVDDLASVPQDLSGKKVLFTAVGDKAAAKKYAEAMGATVASSFSDDIDYLFVGSAASTGKDERAHILNTLGLADIAVVKHGRFLDAANAAGAVGSPVTPVTPAEAQQVRNTTIHGWISDWMRDAYEDEIADADDPARRTELQGELQTELDNVDWELEDADWYEEWVDDQYAAGRPFRDAQGRNIPRDALEIYDVAWGSDIAGIILGIPMAFDSRTGELVDLGEMHD
jgi:hypothetical protein